MSIKRQGTLCTLLLLLSTICWADDSLTLTLAGDVMLGRGVEKKMAEGANIWGDVKPILQKSNITHINQEFVFTTTEETGTEKAFYFKADPKHVKSLLAAGIDSVSLANNHSLDYGIAGLNETFLTLTQAGIQYSGAGTNLTNAQTPSCILSRGKKICFISFTNNMPEWGATPDKPGVFYLPILEKYLPPLLEVIKKTKAAGADLIVVSAHWGRNWDKRPPEGFAEFARAAIDAGTDIFHGHSGHIIQGIEWYKDKPIFYCMGDLVDDYAVQSGRNDLGYVATVTINTDLKIEKAEIYPTKIVDRVASLAKKKDFKWVEKALKDRSKGYGTELEEKTGVIITLPQIQGGSRTALTKPRKPLGRLIGAFKTVSTKEINTMRGQSDLIWQRNYYEHIIRDENSLDRIREYILDNPLKWETDRENPCVSGEVSQGYGKSPHEPPLHPWEI